MRAAIASFFHKIGFFFQSFPIILLRPSQLVNLSRRSYQGSGSVDFWGGKEFVNQGLYPPEQELLDQLPVPKGELLLFGIGGGREALPLGKAGFRVTGVDFVPELVDKAVENGKQAGISIKGVPGEMGKLDFPPHSFDVIWYSCSIYSSIPGRKRRIQGLLKSADLLKNEGLIACFFYWNPKAVTGNLRWKLGKLIALITFGNTGYQRGDLFKDNLEFLHAFSERSDLEEEFGKAGLIPQYWVFPENSNNACALLKKKV